MVTKTDMVADAQVAMSNMFNEQLLSYDHIAQLGTDYVMTIQQSHRVLQYGQQFQMDLKKYSSNKELANAEKTKTLEVLELKFNAFKQMLSLELVDLQHTMRGDLAKAFAEYSTSKQLSLAEFSQQKSEELSRNNTESEIALKESEDREDRPDTSNTTNDADELFGKPK